MRGDVSGKRSYSSLHAIRFSVLEAVIKCTSGAYVSKEQWVEAIAAAMASNSIECVPGSYRSVVTCRRVIRLVG